MRKLVVGPSVCICDACVFLCVDVLGGNGVRRSDYGVIRFP